MENQKKKIKILALCDSPTSATGFAQVSKNVLNRLYATGKYELDVIGINFSGDAYDNNKFPYNIYPALVPGGNDVYGRYRFIQALTGHQTKNGLNPPWDLIFTIQDPFVIEGLGVNFAFAEQLRVTKEFWKRTLPAETWFKWIAYFPVDSVLKENWVTRSISMPDYPVAYCEWGQNEILKLDKEEHVINFNLKSGKSEETKSAVLKVPSLKDRITHIPHGVDLNIFKPVSAKEIAKFRKEIFKNIIDKDTFLIVNINRNQPRKDISRTLKVFAEFKKLVPNSHLYLHMRGNDAGGSIDEMARNFGLVFGKDYTYPDNFDAGLGVPIETVNLIYNAADVCMTTTLGEGWGFITTESMATKTPLIAPNITAITDIFNCHEPMENLNRWLEAGGWDKVRGIPVKAGSTSSEWLCYGVSDNERIRPLTNVDDMVQKLKWIYDNPKEVKKITDRAYEWVLNLSWENVVDKWVEVFDKAYEDLERERALAKLYDNVNRNEPCPCGSGKKFKKCHGEKLTSTKLTEFIGT